MIRIILTIGFFSFLNNSISQIFEKSGIDSVRNIEWTTDEISTDDNGVVNYWERFEFSLELSDQIVIIYCGEKEPFEVITNYIPESCIYWKHADSNTLSYGAKMSDSDTNYIDMVDSFSMVDNLKLSKYYLENQKELDIDTIWVSMNVDISKSDEIAYYLLNKTLYFDGQKHNYEFGYYKIDELKNICILDNFRLKYEGRWKFGEKHGKWKKYDPSGRLIKLEIYKHGKLKRYKSYI